MLFALIINKLTDQSLDIILTSLLEERLKQLKILGTRWVNFFASETRLSSATSTDIIWHHTLSPTKIGPLVSDSSSGKYHWTSEDATEEYENKDEDEHGNEDGLDENAVVLLDYLDLADETGDEDSNTAAIIWELPVCNYHH